MKNDIMRKAGIGIFGLALLVDAIYVPNAMSRILVHEGLSRKNESEAISDAEKTRDGYMHLDLTKKVLLYGAYEEADDYLNSRGSK